MALQWMLLAYTVAVEAAIAIFLTLPSPKLLKKRFVSLISLILQPALFVVPFAGFQILGFSIYSLIYTSFFFNFDFGNRYFANLDWDLRSDLDYFSFVLGFLVVLCRYLLEEWASVDVHFWDLYRCWKRSIWEICKYKCRVEFLMCSVNYLVLNNA